MNIIDLTKHKFSNDRAQLRSELINLFLKEKPGTGKGELTSKYIYIVKSFSSNDVFLKRPAQFNNGFDFTLNVSDINFNPAGRATTRPTHGNILDDLELKRGENDKLFNKLMKEVDNIYNCLTPSKLNFEFKSGLNSEILLECIKWLFAEQDVTYWNYSGRAMFYGAINDL